LPEPDGAPEGLLGPTTEIALDLSAEMALSREAILGWYWVGIAVSHVGGAVPARAVLRISWISPVRPAALAALWTAEPRGIKRLDGM
jgi:hypothetical protein